MWPRKFLRNFLQKFPKNTEALRMIWFSSDRIFGHVKKKKAKPAKPKNKRRPRPREGSLEKGANTGGASLPSDGQQANQ